MFPNRMCPGIRATTAGCFLASAFRRGRRFFAVGSGRTDTDRGEHRSRRNGSGQPESVIAAAKVGREPAAEGRAEIPRRTTPSPAANDMSPAIFGQPGRPVDRRAGVVVVNTVFDPIIAVAGNLVEPPRI